MSYSIVRTCSTCGTANRIPAKHLSDTGRCGSCKGSLSPTGDPINADAESFASIVSEAKVPILVDFWAAWCGPCRMAAPEVQSLANEMAGRALVLKVDTERNPDLARKFRVQSIPNFVLLKGGEVKLQQPGLVPLAVMRRWLEQQM